MIPGTQKSSGRVQVELLGGHPLGEDEGDVDLRQPGCGKVGGMAGCLFSGKTLGRPLKYLVPTFATYFSSLSF